MFRCRETYSNVRSDRVYAKVIPLTSGDSPRPPKKSLRLTLDRLPDISGSV